jgi:hypothetical protein
MENTLTTESTDRELMSAYEALNAEGLGKAIGTDNDSPVEAAAAAGMKVIRRIFAGTTCPGWPVLAQDSQGRLWIVYDHLSQPWAIEVGKDMENTLTRQSTDIELMTAYENLNAEGCGEAVGNDKDSPAEAAAAAGMQVIRRIYAGTNCPGNPCLAEDNLGGLWIIDDLNGPWAVEVG